MVVGAASPSNNVWTHVVIVFNGVLTASQQKIYYNGVEQPLTSTVDGSGAQGSDATETFFIGLNRPASATAVTMSRYKGQLDDVRIYNYARTPTQSAWDYNHGGPIGLWKFDECTGNTAYDASGKGNNGTITLAAGSQTTAGNCATVDTATAWYNGKDGKYNSSLSFDGNDDYIDYRRHGLQISLILARRTLP